MSIQALDDDEERTDNWLAEFIIVSGNEDGRFSIKTDPKTNMGVLYLNKVSAYFVHSSKKFMRWKQGLNCNNGVLFTYCYECFWSNRLHLVLSSSLLTLSQHLI